MFQDKCLAVIRAAECRVREGQTDFASLLDLENLRSTVHGQGILVVVGAVCGYKIHVHARKNLFGPPSADRPANNIFKPWSQGVLTCRPVSARTNGRPAIVCIDLLMS